MRGVYARGKGGSHCFSLRSKRLSNIGRAVLGNAEGARSRVP